jgi:hypothetical protein
MHCAKDFGCIHSFNSPNPKVRVSLSLFDRRGKMSLNNSSTVEDKITVISECHALILEPVTMLPHWQKGLLSYD